MSYETKKPKTMTSKTMKQDKFIEHSKNHSAKHIRLMKKYMKEGLSFSKAHNKVLKELGK